MNWAVTTAFGDFADAPEFVDLYFLSKPVVVLKAVADCCYCCINCMFGELMLVRWVSGAGW